MFDASLMCEEVEYRGLCGIKFCRCSYSGAVEEGEREREW